ncbi:hypothetical protein AJ80_09424 [Polytolypa hystricis UAMH7299]|uniref:Uncharacterized protein n=1 Tax=Polytolypa hystricis (strain UAMH7299) TaxID=1447883 RepID=A0A2B7WQW1_POLH7|nr:hypothetical protein AJ80_09424 [Polytolypa hystricis UAMH7299]
MADLSAYTNTLYASSVLAPENIKQSLMDSWGNVKIPFLSSIPSPANSSGWVGVGDDPYPYSALFDVPITGLKRPGNTTLYLNSTNYELQFQESVGEKPPLDGSGFSISLMPTVTDGKNRSLFHFQPYAYVQSAVSCADTGAARPDCAVTAMREINQFDRQWASNQKLHNMLINLSGNTRKSFSASQAYLHNPNTPVAANLSGYAGPMSLMDVLSVPLAQLFNTFVFAGIDPQGVLQSAPSALANTTGIHTYFDDEPHYVVDWRWIAVFAVSTSVLAVCAIALTFLSLLTLNPDVLGYASTITLHAEMKLPDTGSTLSGDQRARLLKHLAVRFGDVQEHNPSMGRLGIGSADRVSRSQKGRLYEYRSLVFFVIEH